MPCKSPTRPEASRSLPSAKEAGAVAGGEGDGLIQKEQFCPAPPAHHRSATPLVVAGADQPSLAGPAPDKERLRLWIVNDTAVAGEKAALRDGDDLAKRGDAILKRHDLSESDFLSQPFVS